MPSARNSANEMLAAIMRSFGERPAQPDSDRSSNLTFAPQSRKDGDSGINPHSALRNPQS